ncbi:hypothetical protein ACIA5C_10465 [Actinoplanes sp. NPDC051343]
MDSRASTRFTASDVSARRLPSLAGSTSLGTCRAAGANSPIVG